MTWRRWRERAWVPRGSDNEETMIPEEVSRDLPLRTVNSRVTATAVPMTRQIPRFARTCQALPQGASMRRKSCAPCSRRTGKLHFFGNMCKFRASSGAESAGSKVCDTAAAPSPGHPAKTLVPPPSQGAKIHYPLGQLSPRQKQLLTTPSPANGCHHLIAQGRFVNPVSKKSGASKLFRPPSKLVWAIPSRSTWRT